MKRWVLLLIFAAEILFARTVTAYPGAFVTLPYTPSSRTPSLFGHRAAACLRHGKKVWLFAVPLGTKPGRYPLEISGKFHTLIVEPKAYPLQCITLKDPKKVTPPKTVYLRLRKERERKRRDKAFRSETVADADFLWPVEGVISGVFGSRRVFNGKPRASHRGVDIAAAEGRPVRAASSGTVVDTGNFYFSGNFLFIEHGQGVTTLYAHLLRFVVRPGERVEKGQVVGYVGQTGRATGPHLHFGVLVDGVYVDPLLFLSHIKKE